MNLRTILLLVFGILIWCIGLVLIGLGNSDLADNKIPSGAGLISWGSILVVLAFTLPSGIMDYTTKDVCFEEARQNFYNENKSTEAKTPTVKLL